MCLESQRKDGTVIYKQLKQKKIQMKYLERTSVVSEARNLLYGINGRSEQTPGRKSQLPGRPRDGNLPE